MCQCLNTVIYNSCYFKHWWMLMPVFSVLYKGLTLMVTLLLLMTSWWASRTIFLTSHSTEKSRPLFGLSVSSSGLDDAADRSVSRSISLAIFVMKIMFFMTFWMQKRHQCQPLIFKIVLYDFQSRILHYVKNYWKKFIFFRNNLLIYRVDNTKLSNGMFLFPWYSVSMTHHGCEAKVNFLLLLG